MRQEGMYICQNCGETFNREDMVSWTEPHGEVLKGCPNCNADDYVEAQRCRICGKYHDPEDMYYDFCESCLDNTAKDWELMLEYLKDENLLADFVFWAVFYMDIPDDWHISDELKEHIESVFRQKANLAKFEMHMAKDGPIYMPLFFTKLLDYIHIDTHYSLDHFASWLDAHPEKAGAK